VQPLAFAPALGFGKGHGDRIIAAPLRCGNSGNAFQSWNARLPGLRPTNAL